MNNNVKAFASQSESCIVYIQIAFQILAAFYQRLLQVFLRRWSARFVSVSCPDVFVWPQENKNTSSKSQRDVSLLKKNSFKERAERLKILVQEMSKCLSPIFCSKCVSFCS